MSKEFWESQAKGFEYDVKAVNFDLIEEDLEFHLLDGLLTTNKVICDVGCGNGRTIINYAQKYKDITFHGIDFSENMIKIADNKKEELDLQNAQFYTFDATSKDLPGLFDFKFDKVLSKRLLINTKGRGKLKAIKNIHNILEDDGIYIMIECFIEPLNRINDIRQLLDLDEIKVKEFNEYLTMDFIDEIKEYFEVMEKHDFESLYYFISRVFNAYLSEGEPDYHAPINELSSKLIKSGINPIQGYSPEIAYILKKV